MDQDNDPGPRDAQCGAVLCWRRDPDAAPAPPPGTARALSEVTHWVRDRQDQITENTDIYLVIVDYLLKIKVDLELFADVMEN